jgi:hypothetical protein
MSDPFDLAPRVFNVTVHSLCIYTLTWFVFRNAPIPMLVQSLLCHVYRAINHAVPLVFPKHISQLHHAYTPNLPLVLHLIA